MARTFTVAQSCSCGASMAVDGRSHRLWGRSLIHSFTQLHNQCITALSDEVDERSRGDVFTQSLTHASDHTFPELQTGFQRLV